MVLPRDDASSVVGVRGLQLSAPHIKANLGYWSREGQKRGVNNPLC